MRCTAAATLDHGFLSHNIKNVAEWRIQVGFWEHTSRIYDIVVFPSD